MRLRTLLLLCAVALASCIDGLTVQHAVTRWTAQDQILVMIREAALQRYRPGALPGASYGRALPAVARVARALAKDHRLQLLDDWAMPALGVRCYLAQPLLQNDGGNTLAQLAADPRVESVQALQRFHGVGHGDPYYRLQSNAAELHLGELHRLSRGRGARIAVIDTGVELKHPDLEGQISAAIDFVGDGYIGEFHGTAVAGIIAASADNGVGIVGVAPEARLIALRACWSEDHGGGSALCTSFTLAKAVQYALTQEVQVINMSLSGPPDRLLDRLLDKAVSAGTIVVAAIDPQDPEHSFPAGRNDVIAVAAAGQRTLLAHALHAPGTQVLTTATPATWSFVSGNSFAAAHVSGIAGLLLASPASPSPPRAARLLAATAHVTQDGAAVDACAALAAAVDACVCSCRGMVSRPRTSNAAGP